MSESTGGDPRERAPAISVLTPVYNGERHLAECIESVLAQTRTDWEYIIVDNRSDDRTAALADSYAQRDERIRVVRYDDFVNVHRSFSRAARLMDPRSQYCKFLSANDWIYPECLERMVAVAERHPQVGVVSSYCYRNDRLAHAGVVPYTQNVMSGKDIVRAALANGQYCTGTPTQLLYRAELVRATMPFFDETYWHSDTHAAFCALLNHDLGFVHRVLSYSRPQAQAPSAVAGARFNTSLTSEVRLLARFGADVFGADEFRQRMRTGLRRYGWFLAKQRLNGARQRDRQFHEYHRAEIAQLLASLGADHEFRSRLKSLQLLVRDFRAAHSAAAQPAH